MVLFRGVGGATQLPTKPLKETLTKAGYANVATYINSGNAVLVSDRPETEIAVDIAEIVRREFGFEKDIMLVTSQAWSRLVTENPFPEAVDAPTTLHAFMLSDIPAPEAVEALVARTTGRERVVVAGKVLYFHAPDGFGRSKLPPVVDRTLKVVSTARNWNTVVALQSLAVAASEN
ncbi:DUF1697 domain-containing protein [Pseudaminobacter soli (ex Li et al. 2025)]|uniref:DUF1697 domain-containing protein n=1 Tax=Pseudaminobacter soli (ex Li et al. 2025) TaxID=1295366 RepID=UPI001FE1BF41|nr:DUF1697 domain-containing protein [Mesorhizobium soli]